MPKAGVNPTRANQFAFALIVAILALSPIPVASNRPFFWMVNAIVVATTELIYAIALRLDSKHLRVPLRAVALPGALLVTTILWMIIQATPLLQGWVPQGVWGEASKTLAKHLAARISVDPAATLGMIVRFTTYGIFFFLVLQATANRFRARKLIVLAFWIIVVHASIAILMLVEFGDQFLFFPKWAYQGYATGFFVNRNSFATFGAFGIALGTILALEAHVPGSDLHNGHPSRVWRVDILSGILVYGAGIAILATAVALSGSRMGALAAVAGVLTVFVISFARLANRRSAVLAAFAFVTCVAFAVLAMSGGGLAERIGSVETSADDRLLLYRQVVDMISARPWVGFGGGTFAEAFPPFHRLPLSADVTWDAAHNSYLELYANLEIVALAPLLTVLLLFVRQIYGLFNPKVDWIAPASAVAVVVVGAVHSLVDFSLQIEANAFMLVAILATGTAQVWIGSKRSTAASRLTLGSQFSTLRG